MTVELLDTAEECARWLRVNARTIRSWGKRGIVSVHDGLFVMAEVGRYIEQRDKTGRPAKRHLPCTQSKIM